MGMASDNKSLGTFRLDGIPPAPRGVPQIEVTFDIDANGILSVSAKDKGTNKEQSITITGTSTLPEDEVNKMVEEAEKNAAADKDKKELIGLKNQAESLCYQSEKQINELGDKIDGSLKEQIQKLVEETREAISKDNLQEIKAATDKLQNEIMNIGKQAYEGK